MPPMVDPADVAPGDDTAALVRAHAELQQRCREKDALLGLLGHELRNSLAPISMALDLLRRPGFEQSRAGELSEVAARQMRQAVSLIDELADLGRALSGSLVLHPEELSLAAIVAGMAEHENGPASRRPLAVHCPEDALEVRADPTRIAQLLQRLVECVEACAGNGTPLRLHLRRDGAYAEITIGSAGEGAVESTSADFDLSAERAGSPVRPPGIAAFRLWFARALARLHDGDVRAWRGATPDALEFRVQLPLIASTPSKPACASARR